ncbi:hypothetical protein [Pedobacter sp. UYP30]|uniref:hypothetical protein n=1 Tax=Pedobacter sp. UYP30 TaxID=1756400 RepID=UPI003392D42A
MKAIKKLLLLVAIPIVMSCKAMFPPTVSSISEKTYIGMPLTEFKKLSGEYSILESMEKDYTVYKVNDYYANANQPSSTKFFYFDSSNKLYKIDSGDFRRNRYRL